MKKALATFIVTVLTAGVFLSLHASTFAQEGSGSSNPPVLETQGSEAPPTLGDMGVRIQTASVLLVSDACAKSSNSVCDYLDISLVLVNEGTAPRTVSYGVFFNDAEKATPSYEEVLYVTPPLGDFKLYPGEAQTLVKRVPLPAFLGEGVFSVSGLVVEKSSGTVLGFKRAGYIAPETKVQFAVSGCTLGENIFKGGEALFLKQAESIGTLSCAVTQKGPVEGLTSPRLFAVVSKPGELGIEVARESVPVNQDGKTKTTMTISGEQMSALAAGTYTLRVFAGDDSGETVLTQPIIAAIDIEGSYAVLGALTTDKASYSAGENAQITMQVKSRSLDEGAKVEVILKDSTGVCGKGEATLGVGTAPVIVAVPIDRACTLETLTANIKNSKGAIVSSEMLDWNVPSQEVPGFGETAPTETAGKSSPLNMVFFTCFSLMLLVLFYVLFVDKKNIPTNTIGVLLMVAAAGILPLIPHEASAWLGQAGFTWQYGCPAGDIDNQAPEGDGWARVMFDRASYNPGDTVRVTATMAGDIMPLHGVNSVVYWLNGSVRDPGGSTVWSIPNERNGDWNPVTSTWDGDGWTGSPQRTFTYTFTAPGTAGTYTFNGGRYSYRPDTNPINPPGPCGTWNMYESPGPAETAFIVTTTPPPAPVANLTVNGSHAVTVNVGDALNYAWWITGGPANAAGSNYTTAASCPGGPGPTSWVAGIPPPSSTNSTALASQAGCTYTITYTVSGPGGSDGDSVTVTINPSGPPPPSSYSCLNSVPGNAVAWDAEESAGLAADTPWVHGDPDGAPKCQYHCIPSFTWNGSSCVPNTYSCLNGVPANADEWDSEESASLIADTPWVYGDPDGAPKCQYHCRAGSTWNGTSCVPLAVCGNSIREIGEDCDPPNGTTCSPTCKFMGTNGKCSVPPRHYNCAVGSSTWGFEVEEATKWTWTCGPDGVGSEAYCTEFKPNLTSASLSLNSGALEDGQTVTFRSTLSNNSGYTTPGSFSDDFNYRYGTSGGWTPLNTIPQAVLGALGQRFDVSSNIPLNQTGTLQVRHCVDSALQISESNEGDNCQTVDFTVNAAPPPPPPPPAPVCSGSAPQAASTGATWGTFYVYAQGVSASVTSVLFPTWGDQGGQDDIVWYPGVNMGGGTWRAAVDLGMHELNDPEYGNFNVHIYMYDPTHAGVWCGTANFTRTINQPPTVDAGPDIPITLPIDEAFPVGDAIDSDGSIAALLWTPRSFPTLPTIMGETTLTPTFDNMNVEGIYIFRLRATDNLGATAFNDMQVVVGALGGGPILTFDAAPPSIPAGNSSTLRWTVAGPADSCWASGGWTGWKAFSGTNNEIQTPPVTTTYELECWNAGVSSGKKFATITVTGAPGGCSASIQESCTIPAAANGETRSSASVPPTSCVLGYTGTCSYECNSGTWTRVTNTCMDGDITATDVSVGSGGSTNILWSSSNAASCNVTSNPLGFNWAGVSSLGQSAGPLFTSTDFYLTCTPLAGPSRTLDSVSVTVVPTPNLSATPTLVDSGGGNVTIDWDTNNGDESDCSLVGGSVNIPSLPHVPPLVIDEVGSITTFITARTTFTLTCPLGSDSVTVEVKPKENEY